MPVTNQFKPVDACESRCLNTEHQHKPLFFNKKITHAMPDKLSGVQRAACPLLINSNPLMHVNYDACIPFINTNPLFFNKKITHAMPDKLSGVQRAACPLLTSSNPLMHVDHDACIPFTNTNPCSSTKNNDCLAGQAVRRTTGSLPVTDQFNPVDVCESQPLYIVHQHKPCSSTKNNACHAGQAVRRT
ncbi:MAG: hypothetical protein R3220_05825 [Balneolaceae bacterium]|nr:hypothetical protein [Balneolaceae bacterium]